MRNKIFFLSLLFVPIIGLSQNVGVGTTTPLSRLEVKDTSRTTLTVSSKNFADTSQLVLSNRRADNLGTDMIVSANQERGMRISSQSDLAGNRHDSIMTLTPQGRVGINNSNPAERLDVRGDVNITGTIKTNGDAGRANQVLMQDGSGNLAWGDIGNGYKNFETFSGAGSGTWTVPAGVTEILVEVTGAGAGGTIWGGGGGGGYIAAKLNVTPGNSVNYTVGAGSAGTAGSNSTNAGSSSLSAGSVTLNCEGGWGGTFNATFKTYGSAGGSYSAGPASFRNFIGIAGGQGRLSQLSFQQKSATAFYEIVSDGKGGGPGYCRTCGAEGYYIIYDNAAAAILRYTSTEGRAVAGSGGGGGYLLTAGGYGGGGGGKDGLIIIRY